LNEASTQFGGTIEDVPDIIINCAGTSIPKLFVEATIEEFESQMKLNYFGAVYTVHVTIIPLSFFFFYLVLVK
jgi:3-dehydrosphinganine reductase